MAIDGSKSRVKDVGKMRMKVMKVRIGGDGARR